MATYRNDTNGARAIHLWNDGYVLVEPGAIAEVEERKVKRVGPGLKRIPSDLPEVPADLVKAVAKAKPAAKPRRTTTHRRTTRKALGDA